jgi:hypothetical protein
VFLTPVFFYVIGRLGSAPMFTTPRAQQLGRGLALLLNLLFLGLPHLLSHSLRPRREPPQRLHPTVEPSADGPPSSR